MAQDKSHNLDSLLEIARRHIRGLTANSKLPATLTITFGLGYIGKQGFSSVTEQILNIGGGSNYQEHEAILVAEAYLQDREVDLTIPRNNAAATRLQEWTIERILPSRAFAIEPPFATESKPVVSAIEAARILSLKEAGLHLLCHLQRLQSPPPEPVVPTANLIACLASFSDPRDPWTSQESHELSQSLLSSYVSILRETPKQFDSLIRDLLLSHIKPLFLECKNPLLTPQARRAISPLPGPSAPSDFEAANKPWRFHSPHIVTVFQWVLSQLHASLVEAHWPLVIPPLLTILDDVSIPYKIKGCSLLLLLLKVCPVNLLERSGLGEIFHDTLMPYLLYLPPLTPEEESTPFLEATYTTLIALTLAHYATPDKSTSKIKALDSIFRYGILKGYAHAGEHARLARLLMERSADLVDAMGIYCVKHLKDLLPIISEILTAPFATAYPPLLKAALGVLKAVVVNGWPRVGYHRGEILQGLIVCWCRIDEEVELTKEFLEFRGQIEEILRAVVRLLGDDEVAKNELQMLRESDSRFEVILKV